MSDLLLYFLLVACVFLVGMATGIVMSRFASEKKERDFLKRMEILGTRNNEILDDLKNVISFNNQLAEKNKDLSNQIDIFIKEWNT